MMKNKQKRMAKPERIKKLRMLLESYKKIGTEPEVTELAKYLDCSRQTLYSDSDYSDILEEYEVGRKFKKSKIAPQDYLLERIRTLENTIIMRDNKIKRLQEEKAELETIVKELEEKYANEQKRVLRIQIYYLHLADTYNGLSNSPITLEPHDIHNLDKDPLDITPVINNKTTNTKSKLVNINKR